MSLEIPRRIASWFSETRLSVAEWNFRVDFGFVPAIQESRNFSGGLR